jgi:hypothetical protein
VNHSRILIAVDVPSTQHYGVILCRISRCPKRDHRLGDSGSVTGGVVVDYLTVGAELAGGLGRVRYRSGGTSGSAWLPESATLCSREVNQDGKYHPIVDGIPFYQLALQSRLLGKVPRPRKSELPKMHCCCDEVVWDWGGWAVVKLVLRTYLTYPNTCHQPNHMSSTKPHVINQNLYIDLKSRASIIRLISPRKLKAAISYK